MNLFTASKAELPRGLIVAWYGLFADIPEGWAKCDGGNGTPDLRERFIRGASSDDDVGDAIGEAEHRHRMDFGSHTHSFSAGSHDHALKSGSAVAGGSPWSVTGNAENVSGTTGGRDLDSYTNYRPHIPLSRQFFWIMKL